MFFFLSLNWATLFFNRLISFFCVEKASTHGGRGWLMKTWLINSASAHQPSCITRSTPTTSHSPPPMQKINLVTLLNCTSHQKLFLLDYGFLGRNLSAVILAVRIKCGQIWENSIIELLSPGTLAPQSKMHLNGQSTYLGPRSN